MDPLRVSQIRSSASTPSLRSRDGSLPHMKMDAGGNVRVVVRVRAFLPRGTLFSSRMPEASLCGGTEE
jgi:hypothetical protein